MFYYALFGTVKAVSVWCDDVIPFDVHGGSSRAHTRTTGDGDDKRSHITLPPIEISLTSKHFFSYLAL